MKMKWNRVTCHVTYDNLALWLVGKQDQAHVAHKFACYKFSAPVYNAPSLRKQLQEGYTAWFENAINHPHCLLQI